MTSFTIVNSEKDIPPIWNNPQGIEQQEKSFSRRDGYAYRLIPKERTFSPQERFNNLTLALLEIISCAALGLFARSAYQMMARSFKGINLTGIDAGFALLGAGLAAWVFKNKFAARETRTFAVLREQETILTDDGLAYLEPQILYDADSERNPRPAFGIIYEKGQRILAPLFIRKVIEKINIYHPSHAVGYSPNETLYMLAKAVEGRSNNSPIDYVLHSPLNHSIKGVEFCKFLLQHDQGGNLRLFLLNEEIQNQVLSYFKLSETPIPLENFDEVYVGALLNGNQKAFDFLTQAKTVQKITFTNPITQAFERAADENNSFTSSEISQMNPYLRRQLFWVASAFGSLQTAAKLQLPENPKADDYFEPSPKLRKRIETRLALAKHLTK